MDKVSFYNIKTKYNNYVLLYNTLTNSLICFTCDEFIIVNELFDDLICFKSEYPLLFKELKNAGFIVNQNFDELEYIKLQNNRAVFISNGYHLTINPTLDCNLHCWYCSTEYAKAKHHGAMTSKTINMVKSHIQNLVEIKKASSIHLDWFGGEPLMYFNEVIKPISSFTKELVYKNKVGYSQHITTNATLMDADRIHQMKDLQFTSFQIPIDGNEYHHNIIKHFEDKMDTYRLVVNNINLIAEIIPNVRITLRINYDKQTLKHISDIIKDIAENTKKHIQVDFQKVWQISCNNNDFKMLKDVKTFFHENGLESGFWAYIPQNFIRCYADRYHHYAINYDGKIFKCTAQNYADDKIIGTLKSTGAIQWNDELLSKLFSKATFENERCLKCKSLPVCMGPCIIRNFESVKNNTPLPCIEDYVQYSLSSFIIDEAQKRNLITESSI